MLVSAPGEELGDQIDDSLINCLNSASILKLHKWFKIKLYVAEPKYAPKTPEIVKKLQNDKFLAPCEAKDL